MMTGSWDCLTEIFEVPETVLFKETGLPKGGLNQRFGGGLAVLCQQALVE